MFFASESGCSSDFAKKNVDNIMILKDRINLLNSLLEEFDRKQDLLDEVESKDTDDRKIRKVGEKPIGLRQSREVQKNAELYREENPAPEDS